MACRDPASAGAGPRVSVLLVLLPCLACGPGPTVATDPAGTTGGEQDGSTAATPPPATDESDADGATTASVDDTGASSLTTGSFLEGSDEGSELECDVFSQDCPAGSKCMPWANDGGSAWNSARCTPIAEDPGQPGDPCTMEASPVSGIDDCDLGVMCWDVDPETLEGVCVPQCSGSDVNPTCDDPDDFCALTAELVLALCLPWCDPLAQDCPRGEACYAVVEHWECSPDASETGGAYGDVCEFLNVCDPGLVCLEGTAVPGCMGIGCCSDVCDLNDPQCTGAPEGQTCQPWYLPGQAPPGYGHIGVCALPP